MTRRTVTPPETDPYYKVRIVFPGAILHVASRTEPRVLHEMNDGAVVAIDDEHVLDVEADWITDDPEKGDVIGFVDWSAVVAVTWRSTAATGTAR